jgi:hypothetical protein
MAHKDFDAEQQQRALVESHTPTTFTLGGQDFMVIPIIPLDLLMRWESIGPNTENAGEAMIAVFRDLVIPDQADDIARVLPRADVVVVVNIVNWIMGEKARAPLADGQDSSSTPSTNGTPSTESSAPVQVSAPPATISPPSAT